MMERTQYFWRSVCLFLAIMMIGAAVSAVAAEKQIKIKVAQ